MYSFEEKSVFQHFSVFAAWLMQAGMTYHNMTCHQKKAEKTKVSSWKLMLRKTEQEKCMHLRMSSLFSSYSFST